MPKAPTATLLDANYVYGMGRISEALRHRTVEHAFVGGTAVQALCCYLDTNKGAFSITDELALTHVAKLRRTDDYDIITLADERAIRCVLADIQGEEILNDEIYETEITSKGWKNPSIRIQSTLQEPMELRINFSVATCDSKLLPAHLYETEINSAEEVEFRKDDLRVPVRITNPEYILASKIARNHNTSDEKPKDFYDARLLLEAIARYNESFASLEGEAIRLDWLRIISYVPVQKIDNITRFADYLRAHGSWKGSIDDILDVMPSY